jgi:hypothetical protein
MRALALALGFALALPAAQDPFVGLWKVNFDKSTSTGAASSVTPKSATVRYEPVPGGMKVTSEVIMPDGRKQAIPERLVRYDGKEYPRYANSPPGDVVVNKRLDTLREETIYKRNGRIRAIAVRGVSADGRTMTLTSKGLGPDGKEQVTVTVFDRQDGRD